MARLAFLFSLIPIIALLFPNIWSNFHINDKVAIAQEVINTNGTRPAFVKVIVNVNNTGGGTAQASDFTIAANGNSPVPTPFDGSEQGTIITIQKGDYSFSSIQKSSSASSNVKFGTAFSGDCTLGVGPNNFSPATGGGHIGPGGKQTCIITEINPKFPTGK